MQLVTYQVRTQFRAGLLVGEWVIDLQRASAWAGQNGLTDLPDLPNTLLAFLEGWDINFPAAAKLMGFIRPHVRTNSTQLIQRQALYALAKIQLSAPLPKPGKVISVGANYPASGATPIEFPGLILKTSSFLIGTGQTVRLARTGESPTSAAQLVIVIGKQAKYVNPDRALSYIAGYTQANLIEGRRLDSIIALGPSLLIADEDLNPDQLAIQTRLNGQIIQAGSTAAMYFDIAHLVSHLSSMTTLEPGDLILTGSPQMMAGRADLMPALKPGDWVEVEIGPLGVLANPIEQQN